MNFSVTILGSGAAIPLTHRNPSAQLINVHDRLYLFDCAEGTQVQLRKNHARLQKISHIFITHLHGDHYYGLMGLITTLHLLGRETDLHVYAHAPLEEIIDLHLKVSNTTLRYPLHFHVVDPDKREMIMDDGNAEVSSLPMIHNFPTSGYIIREKPGRPNIRKDFVKGRELKISDYESIKSGKDYVDPSGRIFPNSEITIPPRPPRSYAYCTDTAYNEAIIPEIKGVDLLYHETTFMEDRRADAEAKFHSTAKQAATIALKSKAGKLLIGHYSARYKDLDALLKEARSVFPGTLLGVDGLTIDI